MHRSLMLTIGVAALSPVTIGQTQPGSSTHDEALAVADTVLQEEVDRAIDLFLAYRTEIEGMNKLVRLPASGVVEALRSRVFHASPPVADRVRGQAYGVVATLASQRPSIAPDLLLEGLQDPVGVRAVLPVVAQMEGHDAVAARKAVEDVLVRYANLALANHYSDAVENQVVADSIETRLRLGGSSGEFESLCRGFVESSDASYGIRRAGSRVLAHEAGSEASFLSLLDMATDVHGKRAVIVTLAEKGDAAKLSFGGNPITPAGQGRVEGYVLDCIRSGNDELVKASMVASVAVMGSRVRVAGADGVLGPNPELAAAITDALVKTSNEGIRRSLIDSLASLDSPSQGPSGRR